MLVIGILLMFTQFLGLDKAFLLAGILFAALGCGDLFYDNRYKRRF